MSCAGEFSIPGECLNFLFKMTSLGELLMKVFLFLQAFQLYNLMRWLPGNISSASSRTYEAVDEFTRHLNQSIEK